MAGKKELIMASATRLLEQKNYKELSVLDIVADSNVNRNTFYYHFKDMPALVEALACRCIDRIFSDGDTDLVQKLWLVVDTMYETGRDLFSKYRETGEGGLAKHYTVPNT